MKTACRLFLGALLFIATADIASAVCSFTVNHGKVKRIYPTFAFASQNIPRTYFRLIPGQTAALTDPNGYYFISAIPAENAATQLYSIDA